MAREARESRVNVMVAPSVRDRIEFYSSGMGLSMSALCSFIISDYVFRQDLVLNQMLSSLNSDEVAKLVRMQVDRAKETLEAMEREASPTA